MNNFEYKGQIINTHVVNFKNRIFLLDETIIGSDIGIIAIFSDGTVETLYIDCENPNYSYSSESYDPVIIKYEIDRIKSVYLDVNGEETYIKCINSDFLDLGIDIKL